jgi:hypothetical protein
MVLKSRKVVTFYLTKIDVASHISHQMSNLEVLRKELELRFFNYGKSLSLCYSRTLVFKILKTNEFEIPQAPTRTSFWSTLSLQKTEKTPSSTQTSLEGRKKTTTQAMKRMASLERKKSKRGFFV